MDQTHLNALRLRLSHERARLEAARAGIERELRTVWVAQIEQEIADEIAFLGLNTVEPDEMTDDELLALLGEG